MTYCTQQGALTSMYLVIDDKICNAVIDEINFGV